MRCFTSAGVAFGIVLSGTAWAWEAPPNHIQQVYQISSGGVLGAPMGLDGLAEPSDSGHLAVANEWTQPVSEAVLAGATSLSDGPVSRKAREAVEFFLRTLDVKLKSDASDPGVLTVGGADGFGFEVYEGEGLDILYAHEADGERVWYATRGLIAVNNKKVGFDAQLVAMVTWPEKDAEGRLAWLYDAKSQALTRGSIASENPSFDTAGDVFDTVIGKPETLQASSTTWVLEGDMTMGSKTTPQPFDAVEVLNAVADAHRLYSWAGSTWTGSTMVKLDGLQIERLTCDGRALLGQAAPASAVDRNADKVADLVVQLDGEAVSYPGEKSRLYSLLATPYNQEGAVLGVVYGYGATTQPESALDALVGSSVGSLDPVDGALLLYNPKAADGAVWSWRIFDLKEDGPVTKAGVAESEALVVEALQLNRHLWAMSRQLVREMARL